jgi:hypothetical protein
VEGDETATGSEIHFWRVGFPSCACEKTIAVIRALFKCFYLAVVQDFIVTVCQDETDVAGGVRKQTVAEFSVVLPLPIAILAVLALPVRLRRIRLIPSSPTPASGLKRILRRFNPSRAICIPTCILVHSFIPNCTYLPGFLLSTTRSHKLPPSPSAIISTTYKDQFRYSLSSDSPSDLRILSF